MFTIVAATTRWHDRCQQQRREQTDRQEEKSDNMIHVCIHLRRRAVASGACPLFGRPQLGWIRRRRRRRRTTTTTTASVDLCVCIFPLGRSLSSRSRIMPSINKEEGGWGGWPLYNSSDLLFRLLLLLLLLLHFCSDYLHLIFIPLS